MTINLDFTGIEATPIITCTIEGILEPEDLRELLVAPMEGEADKVPAADPSRAVQDLVPAHSLKKLREKHHNLARLVARGMTQSLAAQLVGYTPSYAGTLLNNPAMQELIEYYRIQAGNAQEVIINKLQTVALKAVQELDERLDEKPEGLSAQELLGVAKLGLDRSGLGPSTKHEVINETHLFDHAQLQELNRAAKQRSAQRIAPIAEVRKALPAPGGAAEGVKDAGAEGGGVEDAGG